MGTAVADKSLFQIQMKGAELVPETVRASDLAELLVRLEGAITETARALDIEFAYDTDEALVSLVRVAPGQSSDLTFGVAFPISPAVSLMTEAIASRRFTALPFDAQEHLHALSVQAIKRRWAYEFHPVNGLRVAPAVISYEFEVPKPQAVKTTSGESDIWGHLVRVGGDRHPKALLRLRNRKLFPVEVTKAIVLELQNQQLIYKDIGLAGVATWRPDDWALLSFKATAVLEYRPDETTPGETFRRLAQGSGGRWQGINPDEFVNDLRAE
jgi:hypothetical protein